VFTQNRFHLLKFYQSTIFLADDLQGLKRFTKLTVFEAFQREFFFAVARNKNSTGTKPWVCTDSQFLSIRTILICGFFSKASGSGQTIGETHGN
jgi:hypothetical protein